MSLQCCYNDMELNELHINVFEDSLSMNEIPDSPQELPDNPPLESPPFQEPGEPMYPDTPEPEPVQTPEPDEGA